MNERATSCIFRYNKLAKQKQEQRQLLLITYDILSSLLSNQNLVKDKLLSIYNALIILLLLPLKWKFLRKNK